MTLVRYTKWDGRLHWHFDLEDLGEDAHGLWLRGARGQRVQRGDEPPRAQPHEFVCLVPNSGSWIAYFNLEGEHAVYIDVTTPPRRSGSRVDAVDLDLDVIRWRDGSVTVDDEDEFEVHRHLFAYPPDVVADAVTTKDRLVEAVLSGTEPFGAAPERWVERAAAAQARDASGTTARRH